jgi:UDP-GlcNAc:undecaprenyl-phosphate GlcNAc-1-phosphate transferase
MIGGIAIFVGITASLIASGILDANLVYGLAGAALLVFVGAVDDARGLSASLRLTAQTAAAISLTLGAGVHLTTLGDLTGFGRLDLGLLAIPFSVFAVVGVINAFNMIDGIDGLAGGLSLIVLGALLLLSPAASPERTIMLVGIAAILPYLVCNLELLNPRVCKVFLGDAGSQLLGYLVAWMLIATVQSPTGLEPAAALWLVAIPLTDTLAVMGRRMLKGRSPFKADRGHLHHILARCLGSTRKALAIMLSAAALLAAVGVWGQLQQIAPAILFWSSMLIFALYLSLLSVLPRLYRALTRRLCRPAVGRSGLT